MKNQENAKKNTTSAQKNKAANNKPKNASNGLSSKNAKSQKPRRNTRGKQKNQNPFINFKHLQELCCDNGCINVEIDAEIARCINDCSNRKRMQFSTTPAMIGKYRKKACGVRSDTLINLALCLGNDINPDYLKENGTDIKTLPKRKKTIIDSETGAEKEIECIDGAELLLLIREAASERKAKEMEPIVKIASFLGYSFKKIDGKIYLQIPESKKGFRFEFSGVEKGLLVSEVECEYILTQLKSILDLFEQTLMNYYTSNMAFHNMMENNKDKEHLIMTWCKPDITPEQMAFVKETMEDKKKKSE